MGIFLFQVSLNVITLYGFVSCVGAAPASSGWGMSPSSLLEPLSSAPWMVAWPCVACLTTSRGALEWWWTVVEVFFWLRCGAGWILVPQPGMQPTLPAVKARSLNRWTARGFTWWRFQYWGCWSSKKILHQEKVGSVLGTTWEGDKKKEICPKIWWGSGRHLAFTENALGGRSRENVGAPKSYVRILTPGTCDCEFIWKRIFVDVIKWRILRWDHLVYLGGP